MRVLVAFDKFKDSLDAAEACELAAAALRSCHRDWELDLCPLTDGGDGFADILTQAVGGRRVPVQVTGPRGRPVISHLGLADAARIPAAAWNLLRLSGKKPRGRIAIIEMAAASGLALLRPADRDPWRTSSVGTGQLIGAAAGLNAAAIVLGVGGSATNDLGTGALAALGLSFRDAAGRAKRQPAPNMWKRITRLAGRPPSLLPPIRIACDVTNPLLGPRGATVVYGPQKGLRADTLAELEQAMVRMMKLLCRHRNRSPALARTPGAGAAGGLPFGLMAWAGARLVPGFDLVSAWLRLDARIAAADLVLTGEGRFDETSLAGKGPGAVTIAARRAGKEVHVFAGGFNGRLPKAGWHPHAITPRDYPFPRAKREAPRLLVRSVRAVFSSAST